MRGSMGSMRYHHEIDGQIGGDGINLECIDKCSLTGAKGHERPSLGI